MYRDSKGVPQDYAEAMRWYLKAAAQCDSFAQSCVGYMYYAGQGVPQDYVQACMWANLSPVRRCGAIHILNELEKEMTEEVFAEGKRLASEWMQQHSKPWKIS